MPPTIADLELSIAPLGDGFGLSLRLMTPDIRHGPFPMAWDSAALLATSNDMHAYGAALRDMLFKESKARDAFLAIRAAGLGAGRRLRVRMLLPPELQTVRWESLLDPQSGRALARDGDLLLSRYLSGDDYTPLQLRPKAQLRALVALAAPTDAADYGLALIDTQAETEQIMAGLGDLKPTVIAATWDALSQSLRDGYDICYLVAHGMVKSGQPWLFLVDDQGNADRRRGGALADLLRSLDASRRPRLMVLASCESAGDGYADMLAALGPQLAQAGVPAVLAMQGKLRIATNKRMAPVLFAELLHDGMIDRAVNSARLAVEDEPDWWMPVLYTRLAHGMIWEEQVPAPAPSAQIMPLRSTSVTPEEISAAQQTLASLPTTSLPSPDDNLPPGSWMNQLRRNQHFVGRDRDLQTLAGYLKAASGAQNRLTLLSGMGGVGKTQLAIELAYRYGRYFAGVFWINCTQSANIPNEIARCGGAGQLQLYTEAAGLKIEEQVNLVRARWSCGLPYVLIFDQCEDPDIVRTYDPGGAVRMLITSRSPEWPHDVALQRHTVGTLERAESVALLRQQVPNLSDADAATLATELGDLPLALYLAARFLQKVGKQVTVERYLADLRSPKIFDRMALRSDDGNLPTGHNLDVARTFALSYEQLDPHDAEDAQGLRLLARAAYLVPGEVVPGSLLRASLETATDNLDLVLEVETGIERLINLGLLEQVGEEGLRIHRLVGSYVRQVIQDASAQAAVERAVIAAATQMMQAPNRSALLAFQPILRGVADAALLREDAEAATLAHLLGANLNWLSMYHEAQPYLERALALRERLLGLQHPDTATSLDTLAGMFENQGDYPQSRKFYARALAIREQVLGPNHADTATSLNNLGWLLRTQNDYAAALPLFQRALAIREKVLGRDHRDTTESINCIGVALMEQGEYDQAMLYYEQARAICERILGRNDPYTVDVLNNIAVVLQNQEQIDAARQLYAEVIAISEQVYGPEHPETAISINNLAEMLDQQGEYAQARQLYERVLAVREQALGEHPYTAWSLNNLGALLLNMEEYAAARPLLERALAINTKLLEPTHPNLAMVLHNLAIALDNLEDYAAALPYYERALAIYTDNLDPDDETLVGVAERVEELREYVEQL